jgi:hypothetical protein
MEARKLARCLSIRSLVNDFNSFKGEFTLVTIPPAGIDAAQRPPLPHMDERCCFCRLAGSFFRNPLQRRPKASFEVLLPDNFAVFCKKSCRRTFPRSRTDNPAYVNVQEAIWETTCRDAFVHDFELCGLKALDCFAGMTAEDPPRWFDGWCCLLIFAGIPRVCLPAVS